MNFEDLQTPCYIINEDEYRNSICELMASYEACWPGSLIYGYSVKTNHLPYLISIASEYGWKTEVVSPDEYALAKINGSSDKDIIYNGPQKRGTVIDAVKNSAMVNLDNLSEVELVCSKRSEFISKDINIGLRVNFNLEELCPGETTCRETVGRFGICLENGDFKKAVEMLSNSGIELKGIHMHSSSSSRSLRIFRNIVKTAAGIIKDYNLDGLKYIDIGGGFFGGKYFAGKPSVEEYADTICTELVSELGYEKCKTITLVLEPGAAILATAMDYLVSVLNIRDIREKRVVTVDGTVLHINPMMNPHETPCTLINPGEDTDTEQIIGGSTCMEMDRMYPRGLSQIVELDTKLLFHACGAYMSTHNSSFINAAPAIYVHKDNSYFLLRKKTIESMINF